MSDSGLLRPMPAFTEYLPDETATLALGEKLAALMVPGLVVFLSGHLGAGKTTLARALLKGLGYTGKVKSPTYTLVEVYAVSRLDLYHFDFYRFGNSQEWLEAGFREYFTANAVCLVEWPEKAAGSLPKADLTITLSMHETGRSVTIAAGTQEGEQCLKRLYQMP